MTHLTETAAATRRREPPKSPTDQKVGLTGAGARVSGQD